jgi:hypothetical protein
MPPARRKRSRDSTEEAEVAEFIRRSVPSIAQRDGLVTLWDAHELCDLEICVSGTTFKAHKAVLAAASQYFRAQFTSAMRDGGASAARIEISEMSSSSFEAVLSYMYRGECKVTPSSIGDLLQAASRLEVPDLLLAGAEFVVSHLTAHSCLASWTLVDSLHRPIEFAPVAKECLHFACVWFEKAVASNSLASLSFSQLSNLLSSDAILASEVHVFRALAKWWQQQGSVPSGELGDLMKLIRFECIDAVTLADEVQPHALMAAHPSCTELILDAFKFHALPAVRRRLARTRAWESDAAITWNVDDKHEFVALSVDKLEVFLAKDSLAEGGIAHIYENGMVRATRGWTSCQHYFEFTVAGDEEGNGFPSVGVVTADAPLHNGGENVIGGDHGWGYYLYSMTKVHGGRHDEDAVDGWAGDSGFERFGLLLDMDAGTLSLYLDGVLKGGSTHTGLPRGVQLYAAAEAGTLAQSRLRFNFAARRAV